MAHALVKKRKSKTRIGLSPHKGQLTSTEPGDHRKRGRDLLKGALSCSPYFCEKPTPEPAEAPRKTSLWLRFCPQLQQEASQVDRGSRDGTAAVKLHNRRRGQ